MKFEPPVVEIQKFDIKDVISASGPDISARPETFNPGHCVGGAPDFFDTDCV